MAEKKKKAYEISELDQYLFGQGNHYEIYKKMGAHKAKRRKEFTLRYGHPMRKLCQSSVNLMSGI